MKKEIFVYVSYKNSITNNSIKKYKIELKEKNKKIIEENKKRKKNNRELLNEIKDDKNDISDFFNAELEAIKDHKYNIVLINANKLYFIFKTYIDKNENIEKVYKKRIDLVPYINFRPYQIICEKRKDNENSFKNTNLIIS